MLRLLDEARTLAAEGKHGEALSALVRAWRTRRAPALAELIDRYSAAVCSEVALPGKNAVEKAAEWDRRLADPLELPRLCAFVATIRTGDEAAARVETLAALDDPRVATMLHHFIERPAFTAKTALSFWRGHAEALTRLADPRTPERIETLLPVLVKAFRGVRTVDNVVNRLNRTAAELREKYPAGPPALEPAELAAAEAVVALAKAKTPRKDLAALLDDIYDSPADDAPRLVYADALQELGDPRGEFIALQFARHAGRALTKAEGAREKALLKEHAEVWLGPLSPALIKSSVRFERGFVAAGVLQSTGKARPEAIADCRELATIEELECHAYQVFAGGQLKSLRKLNTSGPLFEGLLTAATPFPLLEDITLAYYGWGRPGWIEAFGDAPGVPALRRLRFGNFPGAVEELAPFLRSSVGRRLVVFSTSVFELSRSEGSAAMERLDVRASLLSLRNWDETERLLLAIALALELRSVHLAIPSLSPLPRDVEPRLRDTLGPGVTLAITAV